MYWFLTGMTAEEKHWGGCENVKNSDFVEQLQDGVPHIVGYKEDAEETFVRQYDEWVDKRELLGTRGTIKKDKAGN